MKALILAAGLGTRLLPFTEDLPKPLFPVAGRPLLDIIIDNLQAAGCKSIIINTHHLHHQIEAFIASQDYAIPVYTRYEPVILGTGGAIKNVADFWDDKPFVVINSDIVTDIDLKNVYDFHLNHDHPATLVLHDDPLFNSVSVGDNDFITGFHDPPVFTDPPAAFVCSPQNRSIEESQRNAEIKLSSNEAQRLTFTGIQVLNPEVLDLIPDKIFANSIDAYRSLISENKKVCVFISKNDYWKDIGTPERYQQVVFEKMAPAAFQRAFPDVAASHIVCNPIKGDGSDRQWYRLSAGERSLIMVAHGIRQASTTSEADAFVRIGRHLYSRGIPVPEIFIDDTFSGLVFLEDLGDINLQALIQSTKNLSEIILYYQSVIDLLIKQSVDGARGFDSSWTYQAKTYDRSLILEKECRYFVEAFLGGYLGMDSNFDDFTYDFSHLADKALEHAVNGFMHRDMQSRNIMVKNNRFYFIDFQGGRLGPLQYDLASLLIDPYVALPFPVQKQLLDYCVEEVAALLDLDPDDFYAGYKYCAVSRNLQILGAFGYLSRIKSKTYFEKYIPTAVKTLKHNLSAFEDEEFPTLKAIVNEL